MIFIRSFTTTRRVGIWNEQMSYFSSFSDEWSRDLKSAHRYRTSFHVESLSKYYKEEEAKESYEVFTAERLETEQKQKLEQQEQLSIEKLRLK
ncbi:hypothetical protein TNCV_1208821 [Trichonephila clavipes]|nr:hypothetical protein TNCV_1208821 [Trichonephila clavipes]